MIDLVVERTISLERNTVGADHPQVFTALGRLGQYVTPGGDECQAVGHGIEGLYSVAADSMQAALAIEGKANRRLGRYVTGFVRGARQQFNLPWAGLDPADRFGWWRQKQAVSMAHEPHHSEDEA
ncbi:hypothetical protein D3C85_1087450 [compost metagenome]